MDRLVLARDESNNQIGARTADLPARAGCCWPVLRVQPPPVREPAALAGREVARTMLRLERGESYLISTLARQLDQTAIWWCVCLGSRVLNSKDEREQGHNWHELHKAPPDKRAGRVSTNYLALFLPASVRCAS